MHMHTYQAFDLSAQSDAILKHTRQGNTVSEGQAEQTRLTN